MNAEETFLQHIDTIDRVCAYVCRRNHVYGDDAAEFTQEVKYRLIENDYAIIRKFKGESVLSTYLVTVINRLYSQYRIERWGKWRPSAEAKRLGDKAITLERLISRDGLTFHEAAETLTTPADSGYSLAELEAMYLRLPPKNPRPMVVSDGETPEAMADTDTAERVQASERESTARSTIAVVDRILETFDPQDRLILRLRFWEARTAPEIAQRLHIDQKKIYKRLEKLLKRMRAALKRAGIERRDIDMLVSEGDQEIRFDFLSTSDGKSGRKSLSPRRRGGR
jgi:RNA polymerase sigma factor (sigma-70 family)